MKKNFLTIAIAAALLVPGIASATENSSVDDTGPVLYGYAQITGSNQFGTHGPEGLIFGAHRIRLGVKGEAVPGVTYNFQYEWDGAYQTGLLNKTLGVTNVPGSSSGVQEAEINFGFIPALQLEVGKFLVPVGMERTQFSGNDLWFIQRSMNQSLGANYNFGMAIHSPDVMGTGLYYKLGIFNNYSLDDHDAFSSENVAHTFGAGQSGLGMGPVGGVKSNGNGRYLFAGMVGYKLSPLLNVEISGARADAKQLGRLAASKSITAWNVGARGGLMGLKYMAEYSADVSPRGVEGARKQDWYVALAANLHQMTLTPDWLDLEPAVRFEKIRIVDNQNGIDATLANTTIGLNYYVNPNNPHAAEVQLNYIVPTQTAYWRNKSRFVPENGYIYNTLALQFQAGF